MLTAWLAAHEDTGCSGRLSVVARWICGMTAFGTIPGDWFRRALRGTMVALLFAGLLGLGAAGAGANQLDQLEDLADDPFAQYEEVEEPNDPLEIPNRFIFAFNQALDFAIFHPAAVLYRKVVPQQGRDALRNFLRNLRAPVILANDLLQGELDRAGTTAWRFAINSTAGVLGLFDVADDMGYAYHDEDFGQTLGVHGTGAGFYIVLPLLGPSNVRDATGLVVDHFMDPWLYVADEYGKEEWLVARLALSGLDRRARNIETLNEIERDAIDFYARIRSLYGQYRENLINNGAVDSIMEPNASRDLLGADESGWNFEEDDLPVSPAADTGTEPGTEPGTGPDMALPAPAPYPDEVGIYRRVVPPSAGTQTDSDAEQGDLLNEQRVIYRMVSPQPVVYRLVSPPPPGATQTARADWVDAGPEQLGGLW